MLASFHKSINTKSKNLETYFDSVINMFIGRFHRNHLGSRQGSNNTSDGNNRESSLDDSGVVDDHEEADATFEHVINAQINVSKF